MVRVRGGIKTVKDATRSISRIYIENSRKIRQRSPPVVFVRRCLCRCRQSGRPSIIDCPFISLPVQSSSRTVARFIVVRHSLIGLLELRYVWFYFYTKNNSWFPTGGWDYFVGWYNVRYTNSNSLWSYSNITYKTNNAL